MRTIGVLTKKTMLAALFERLALTARPARVSEVDKAVFNSNWVHILDDRLLKFPKQPSRHARECARAMRTVSPGETVIKSINRLIDKENLTVTDDADGSFVIMEPDMVWVFGCNAQNGRKHTCRDCRIRYIQAIQAVCGSWTALWE